MVEAQCLNDGCEKGGWTLRKDPSEYKRGVTCPSCGTTRVEIEGSGGETAPRRQQAQQTELVETNDVAESAGSAMAVLDSDMPTGARLGALQKLLQKSGDLVGGISEGYNNYRREKLALQEDRINNMEVTDPELAIECPRCGYEILPKEIPLQDTVLRCPGGCGKAIQLTEPAQA